MDNLKEGRIGFEAIGNTYPVARDIIREDTNIAGIPCAWFIPPGSAPDDIVIYIHGGAFIFGSVNSHAPMVSYIAQALGRKVLVIDYRLAPEYPFPAGMEDCVAVINTLCEQFPRTRFGLIGDSAGGNITMATGLVLKEQEGPRPQYTIVISPWVDLACKNESYERNRKTDTILARPYLMEAAQLYAAGRDLSIPLLSPVNGNFAGLTPVLILCGTHEILEDDAVHLYQRLVKDGVDATLKLFKNELHVWPFMNIHTEASRRALDDMVHFVAKHAALKNTIGNQ